MPLVHPFPPFMRPDSRVLIVENRETTYDNSPFTPLDTEQQRTLRELTTTLWGGDSP